MLNPVVVFQQIAQAGRAGRVDFESGPTKHQFYLSEGQLIYATSSDPYYSLDAFLLRKQSLSKLDQKLIRSRAQEELRPVEAIVQAQGLIPREELAGVMASLVREIAYDLFSWTEGDYSVSAEEAPPSGAMLVEFALDGVLEKGRQVHDKWRKLSGKVPKLEAVLHRAGQGTPTDIEITPEEWQILAAVDDVRNVYEICYELSPNRLQILSRMARLLEKGLLEVVDFKDRTRPGGLGSKGLKFSTVSTVFRNLFSILIERFSNTGEADPGKRLLQAAQLVAAKGHPPVAGLAFEARGVYSAQAVLHGFCFIGQGGDLKSVLRGLSLLLQQALSELRDGAPEEFERSVADMRGVLGIAEELLPDFHLSLHTSVEKALLGEPIVGAPAGARPEVRVEPAAASVLSPGVQPVTEEMAAPAADWAGRPSRGPASEAVTEEVDPDALAPVLQSSSHISRTPQPRTPPPAFEPESVTVAIQAPTGPPPQAVVEKPPAAEKPSAPPLSRPQPTAPVRPAQTPAPTLEKPPVQRPVTPAAEEAAPLKTAKRRAVAPEEAVARAPEAAPATVSAREKPGKARPRVEAPIEEPEEAEEEGGGRNVLVVVLVALVFLLLGVIGVGGYVLKTDKNARTRLQQVLHQFHLVELHAPAKPPRGEDWRGAPCDEA
jgi:uncharacterized protein DUF4388